MSLDTHVFSALCFLSLALQLQWKSLLDRIFQEDFSEGEEVLLVALAGVQHGR